MKGLILPSGKTTQIFTTVQLCWSLGSCTTRDSSINLLQHQMETLKYKATNRSYNLEIDTDQQQSIINTGYRAA